MGRRSQGRDSFAAIRYAVDTGSMPPPPRRSFWARHKRVVLPVAAVTLLGAGFLANESRRQPAATATATLDCASARDVWRPACRPENVQTWVAKAATARDDAPAATGAVDQAKRASTPKRVAEVAKPEAASPSAPQAPAAQPVTPAAEPAVSAKAPPRVAASPEAPLEPARKPEAAKPAPEPVRAAEAKPEPQPIVPAAKLPESQPVQQALKAAEPQPPRPAPPVAQAATAPEPQPVRQAAKSVEPQTAATPVPVEPPRRPASPVKVAEEPAAPDAAAESKARQRRTARLAERAARREAARTERRLEPRVIVVRPVEEPAPRRLARVRPAEPGVRTTAHFPPGFVQALRHYNTRYAYDY
ncbi:MAG TPA: hypothetical protein VF744_02040 [Beijerinckiaceae bacterium]|jgi:hypothetical protein